MKYKMISNLTLVIMLGLLTACNQYKTQKKVENFDRSITSYEVALRWAQYEDAYSYHVSPNGTQPPVNVDRLHEISVTGIDITEKLMNEEKTEAYIKGVVRYYNKNEGTERKIKLEQTWWFSAENKQWFIDAEFPDFK